MAGRLDGRRRRLYPARLTARPRRCRPSSWPGVEIPRDGDGFAEGRVFTIQPARPHDLAFLWDMLWEAAAVDAGVRAGGKEAALALPEIRRYLDGWGRPGDAGVVARDGTGQPVGAAWLRLFPAEAPGYGFVAPDVPEVAIGVAAASRGRGAGGALLDALLEEARGHGYRAVSLAVDRRNRARALYERKGFRDAGMSAPAETGFIMIAPL